MSFSIQTKPIDDFFEISITDSTHLFNLSIISKGALLNSWKGEWEGEKKEFIDGNDYSKGWPDFESLGFKSGKMSPYSCRLNKGQYIHEGVTHTMKNYYLGAHAIHGILYNANFEIVNTDISEDAAMVTLAYQYQKEEKGYPFAYHIEVCYCFQKNNTLSLSTRVTNTDNLSLPLMDGWHPYFSLGDATIDECSLQFQQEGQLEYNDQLLPTGKLIENNLFNKGRLLANIELDNGFLLSPGSSCILENNKFKLTVSPKKNYPYLQLYIPPNRKSIAIENLSAAPDCFNNKMGLQLLQPQESILFETSFSLTKK
jgi:aldose 1-epimerase